jgi:hypothetical protein
MNKIKFSLHMTHKKVPDECKLDYLRSYRETTNEIAYQSQFA